MADDAMALDQPAWGDLPLDVLGELGRLLCSPAHVNSASTVCKSWQRGIPPGVQQLELDMNACPGAWSSKVEQLQRLTPSLRSMKAYISTAVPRGAFGANLRALAGRLKHIEHLDLELSEGFVLSLEQGDELSELSGLRSLTLTGGTFTADSAEQLLRCLCLACPHLEELRLLPEPTCGLGDEQVPLLLQLSQLKVLEFRAYRLTATGLTRLVRLPQLASLACHGLDTCLDAATASCFASNPALQSLHLGCDFELSDVAAQQLRGVAGDLSMRFRWTDKLAGLLRTARLHLQARLVRLDLGCVRLARDPSASLLEPLCALTGLSDLRMSLHRSSSESVTLHLSQLSALSNLQVLHLSKQRAFFPEQRRFSESSIAVPLSPDAVEQLAAGCRRLRSLRLQLGVSDVTAEGLAGLSQFSSLRSLSVSAEPFGSRLVQPVPLDVLQLPAGLTSLELRNIDVVTAPAALSAAVAAAAAEAAAWACRRHHHGGDACPAQAAADAGGGCLWSQGSGGLAAPPRSVLGQLACLRLESCRLRTEQLQALSRALPSLQQLRFSHVAGLTDEGLASCSCMTGLRGLTVLAPQNRALTQASLALLAPLRDLRYLSWQSDDLAALGPVVGAFAQFTTLRLCHLLCTPATVERCVQGGEALLQQVLPYASLELMR